ncbi:Ankyrin-2 [Symbiodinium microadriaticum]|uniref:Ankyrin-2 n=1 Tax=Symbiodinium microadriaticum TaxID=2951 RepID=A0A1Q9EW82_SYMMI|nr:Ankyrin-2 [Symbiodinium microadriaticum]
MWVLRVSDLLEIEGPAPSHEELHRRNLLVEWKPTLLTIFVSHQWLSSWHPDPHGLQLKILQKALQNTIDGTVNVESDVVSQLRQQYRRLGEKEREQLASAYVWLDWFSIPQIPNSKAELGIQSIPFYVGACQLFVALVPPLRHFASQQDCDLASWLSRGWCRAEMWCQLLADRSNGDVPIIVVSGEDQIEFALPLQWVQNPAHEGEFTCQSDRERVSGFVRTALDNKLLRLRASGQIELFRYYAARYEVLVGLPAAERDVGDFVSRFSFPSLQAAIHQRRGMGAVACAALSGDAALLCRLAAEGAPIQTRLSDMAEVGIENGWTPLHLAIVSREESALKKLLQLQADPNTTDSFLKIPVLGLCHTTSSVKMLVEHRADVNLRPPPFFQSALAAACNRQAPVAVTAELIRLGAEVNLSAGGTGMGPLASLASTARSNPHCLDQLDLLIENEADINQPCRTSGIFNIVEWLCRGYVLAAGESRETVAGLKYTAEISTTALGHAVFFGADRMVQHLLDAHADPYMPNKRGRTPAQLARHASVQQVLHHHATSFSI